MCMWWGCIKYINMKKNWKWTVPTFVPLQNTNDGALPVYETQKEQRNLKNV